MMWCASSKTHSKVRGGFATFRDSLSLIPNDLNSNLIHKQNKNSGTAKFNSSGLWPNKFSVSYCFPFFPRGEKNERCLS